MKVIPLLSLTAGLILILGTFFIVAAGAYEAFTLPAEVAEPCKPTPREETGDISPAQLIQRGKLLQRCVDTLLHKKGAGFGPRGTKISKEVAAYLPVGTSFQDAAIILSSAGFDVRVISSNDPMLRGCLEGERVLSDGILSKIWAPYTVCPKIIGDWRSGTGAVGASLKAWGLP